MKLSAFRVSEAQAEQAVVQYLQLHHWEVRRIREDIHNADGYGLPDLLCTSEVGAQLWLEMKRPASARNPRGHVRKKQRELLACWRERGVTCMVADSVDDLRIIVVDHHNVRYNHERILDLIDALMSPRYDWWPV